MQTSKPLSFAARAIAARRRLLQMHYEAKVGHIGGNLSALDAMLYLHASVMTDDDVFVLSKGHAAGALYIALWSVGLIDEDELRSFHRDGTRLAGHPAPHSHKRIAFATGSLGHGLSLASGVALGKRLRGETGRVFCLLSDGECQEGSTWEAFLFAQHQKLSNLVVMVDANGLQGFGTTREVASLDPLADKIRGFGLRTVDIDGHCEDALHDATHQSGDGPLAVVMKTVKGYGISFMENKMEWHYLPMDAQQYQVAMLELTAQEMRETARPPPKAAPARRIGARRRMRNAFCNALQARSSERGMVFFTGDLGFMALEPLKAHMGERFINAGVAEQNMISVAAGVASLGEQCWTYSIAPFIFGRPFEQIRNDVCLHDFDVKMVGNGGGYGYGVMGGSHHALEDYGVLLALQNMRVYVPAFADDLAPITTRMAADPHPGYLRLGRCEKPKDFALPVYAPWRRLLEGQAGVLIVVGPNAGGLVQEALLLPEDARPEIWVVSELPLALAPMPDACRARIAKLGALYVLEEHVAQGSVGHMVAATLLSEGAAPRSFRHFCARGYLSGRYGSQAFHRRECGLDATTVLSEISQRRSVH